MLQPNNVQAGPGRGSIPVTEESVYSVLGVPWGTKEVRYEMDGESISFMLERFGHSGSNQPTMTFLEKKLVNMCIQTFAFIPSNIQLHVFII